MNNLELSEQDAHSEDWPNKLLQMLVAITGAEGSVASNIIQSGDLLFKKVMLSFRVDTGTGFAKIYADIGELPAIDASAILEQVLSAQFNAPAPWMFMPMIHPEGNRLILFSFSAKPAYELKQNDLIEMLDQTTKIILDWRQELGISGTIATV